jgi:hypothetical protein
VPWNPKPTPSATGKSLVVANNFVACYGSGRLDFNLFRLGHEWVQQGITEAVDRLLVHEFGHHFSGDHLSEEYHGALCRLGTGLKPLGLQKPEHVRQLD